MPAFLEVWLPLVGCTLIALSYKVFTDHASIYPVLSLLGVEFGIAGLWAFYRMILYPSYFTPFRDIPTPPNRSWLRGNRSKLIPDNPWIEVAEVMKTLPNKGLIRFYEAFNREVLVITSIDAIKEMNSVKPYDFGHPKQVKYMLGRITSSNFNFLSEHGHKMFRKHLRPAFTVQHTKKLVPSVWQKSQEMIRLIESQLSANPDSIIDFRDYIRRVMWDTSGLAMFGHDFQTLGHPEQGIRDRFALLLAEFSGPAWVRLIMYFIDLRPLLTLLSPLAMKVSPLGQALTYVRGAVDKVVSTNEQNFKTQGKEDLNITSVSVASGIFPHNELIDNGMLFLTAGPNSTGTAIEWGLYELSQRPEMQARLRKELVDAGITSGGKSGADVGTEDMGNRLASLPYLNAICSELIRCYPFVPLSPKVTEKDTTLLGLPVPKDTALAVPVEALNRDPALWGPDADEFNPDRWAGDKALTGGAPNNFAMLSFGAGPNICIGQNQARAFLACVLAAIVARFEIKLVNQETAGILRPAPFKKSEEGPLAKLKTVS